MANRLDTRIRPLVPVGPLEFHERLTQALRGVPAKQRLTSREVVDLPFPEITPETDRSKFRDEYLLQQVLRKYPGFDLGIDTRDVALKSFLDDERRNRETNDRLGKTDPSITTSVRQAFDLAARKAVSILGRFDAHEFVARVRFGPGSTTSLRRSDADMAHKLSSTSHVTRRASGLATFVLAEFPLWNEILDLYQVPILEHDTDLLTCVPKNAKTDRTIAIGPDLNVALQLAAGSCIRRALYDYGIDLSDQSINQHRAFQGSLDPAVNPSESRRYATLDLKSASNSVTTSLVWRILGNHSRDGADLRWYELLDTLRVEYYKLGDETRRYELFSAMGNGSTFELESLIFYALAASSCEILGISPDVTVYGDDLIVPVDVVDLLKDVLSYAGFRLNMDKSFWSVDSSCERFRESCGVHYLGGMDVTPFYVDAPLNTVENIVLAANNLVRWASADGIRDARVLPVYLWLISHLPSSVRRCRIPFGAENDGLISDWDEATPQVARLAGCGTPMGWKVSCLKTRHYESYEYTGHLSYVADRMKAAQRKFKPPRTTPVRKPKTLADDLARGESVVQLGSRVVTEWPTIGPWVSTELYTSLDWVDRELSAWLHHSARIESWK